MELAQLKYRATRLTGLGRSLSRLGGGIGTRGPGEKKLEMDRRLIRERISRLKAELRNVEKHRELLRSQRRQSGLKSAALVGYTSAGKSSIENALTGAGILEDAMLFSTLDTTASNPQMEEQMHVVYETLRELGVEDRPVVTLFNKQDLLTGDSRQKDFRADYSRADYSIPVSAKTGQGLEELKKALLEIIRKDQIYVERLYDFSEAGKIQLIRSRGQLLEESYVPEGIEVRAYVPQDIYSKI